MTAHSSSGPLALGIHWAHDASVAVCSPQGIIFTVAEERIRGLKHYYGFPTRAIEVALRYCGLTAGDIDIVAFTTRSVFYPAHERNYVIDAEGAVTIPEAGNEPSRVRRWIRQNFLDEFGTPMARLLKERPRARVSETVSGMWGEFADRHWSLHEDFLRALGLMAARIPHYYVAHHRAHATSAFRLSGLDDACVITVDGKGDGLSATIYHGHADGRLELVRASAAQDSLGSFYQAVTEALGFVPVDSEYKTMGLAALGSANGAPNPFAGLVRVEDGAFRSRIQWKFRSYNEYNPTKKVPNPLSSVAQCEELKANLKQMSREDFAYFAQAHCEENMLAFAQDALRLTQSRSIVAAGGVLLNVKANAVIRDTLQPDSFFIFPDAGDSGLAAGAAMEALYQAGSLGDSKPRFFNPYLGHSYSDEAIEAAISEYRVRHNLAVREAGPAAIAELLLAGTVIGSFQGRLEMGPRALGNRSVLANPCSTATKDRINSILKGREWFVPFAPAVLAEDTHLYWEGESDYRYMTFAVPASPYARERVPAVVHTDGTMRPQVVSPESNPWLHELITEFKRLSGVGVLLNTSFNRHGLPIVGSPAAALDHLVNGWVDGLAIGPWYVERARS